MRAVALLLGQRQMHMHVCVHAAIIMCMTRGSSRGRGGVRLRELRPPLAWFMWRLAGHVPTVACEVGKQAVTMHARRSNGDGSLSLVVLTAPVTCDDVLM